MGIRENDYIVILSPMVTKLGLSGNKLIIFALIYGFCRDGESEFCGSINYICTWTGVSRNTVLSILKELVDEGLIVKRDYKVNNVKFCAYKIGSAVFEPHVKELDEGSAKNEPNNTIDNTIEKKEKDTSFSKSDSELFEKCWLAYNRKGHKKDALKQWNKLKDDDKEKIVKHIPFYVKSNERKYLKDFERYLSHRTFESVVEDNKTGQILYDPERESGQMGYAPHCGGALNWNEHFNCYIYMGMFLGFIPDGYTDETRPNGARIMLNNGRGTITWNSNTKQWEKV